MRWDGDLDKTTDEELVRIAFDAMKEAKTSGERMAVHLLVMGIDYELERRKKATQASV